MEEFKNALDIIRSISKTTYISVRTDKREIKNNWVYIKELDGYRTGHSFQRFFDVEMIERYFGDVEIIASNSKFILFKLKENADEKSSA